MKVRAVILDGPADAATVAAIREAISSPEQTIVFAVPTIAEIVAQAAYETGVTQREIVGPSKSNRASRARFAVCWAAYRHAGKTYQQIGRVLGDRDHSTIVNAVARGDAMRGTDPAFARLTDKLADQLSGEKQ